LRRGVDGKLGRKPVVEQIVPPLDNGKAKTHKNRELKSITLEVNKGAVQRAEAIQKKSPELAEKVNRRCP
jgi:hypothetical protein